MIRRLLAVSITLLMMTSVLTVGAAAQGGPVPVTEPATYVDVNGVEHGTVTVTELLDPFTGYPEGKGPEPGTKFVVAVLSIEGTGEDGIEIYSPSIWLHDTSGRLWGESLPCCLMDDFPQPALSITTVPEGSLVSGFIGYTVPDDTVIDQVIYQPESGVVLIPADLGTPRPTTGTPVTMTGAEGSSVVGTVKEVTDPFKKFDKDKPPADGARFVMVTASFENAGDAAFEFKTSGAVLRDARGALWAPTSITPAKKLKPAELEGIKLGPGNRVNGRLGYQVPADVALDGLYYQGDGGLFLLADLSGAEAEPPATGEATCDDIKPWWAEVQPGLTRLAALPPFQEDADPMDLAASQAMLAELESIVSDHLAVTPPDPLAAAHRQILGALLLYEQSARDQVAAQDGGDAALLFRSQETFEAAQLTMAQALAALDVIGLDACVSG